MYGTGHAPLLGTCWPPVVAKPKSEVLVSSMDSTKEGGKNLESLAQDSSSDSSLDSGRSEEGEERGPYSAHSFTAQMLYCKAAVSASGGHRLARDYLAALTAAVNGDARLLHLCLHHPVREEDIEVFRTHLLDVWCAEEAAVCEEEAKQGQPKNGASPTHVSEASADEDCSEEYLQAAELFVLSCSPIVRCFLYDVMCAASYQRTQNLTLMEATEKEMVRLGVDCFGIPQERLLALWKIVLAEVQLRKETFNILVPLME